MKVSKSRLVIPAKTQIEAIEMAPAQLNKVINIPKEASCKGEDFSPKINKENLCPEKEIELSNLQNENKRLQDQPGTQSNYVNKIQNIKKRFEGNSQLTKQALDHK